MAQNKNASGLRSGGTTPRPELSPWLKERLVERKLHAAGFSGRAPLGEHTSRLTRRVMGRQPLISGAPSRMSVSDPLAIAHRESYAQPPGWQAMVLLLSHSGGNLERDENPVVKRWTEPSGTDIRQPARQVSPSIDRSPADHRKVTPAVAGNVPRPAHGKILPAAIIEEIGDRRAGTIGSKLVPRLEERKDREHAGSEMSAGSYRAFAEVRAPASGEGSASPEFAPQVRQSASSEGTRSLESAAEADIDLTDTASAGVERVIRNPAKAGETADSSVDGGVRRGKNLKTELPPRIKERRKQVVAKKELSAKGQLSSPPGKQGQPPSHGSRRKVELPEIAPELVASKETAAQKMSSKVVRGKTGASDGPSNRRAPENSDEIAAARALDSAEGPKTRNTVPVGQENDSAGSLIVHQTGKSLSERESRVDHRSGQGGGQNRAKEIRISPSQRPVRPPISKKAEDTGYRVNTAQGSSGRLMPEMSGPPNRAQVKNSDRLNQGGSSGVISSSPGVVGHLAPQAATPGIHPVRPSSQRPAGGPRADRSLPGHEPAPDSSLGGLSNKTLNNHSNTGPDVRESISSDGTSRVAETSVVPPETDVSITPRRTRADSSSAPDTIIERQPDEQFSLRADVAGQGSAAAVRQNTVPVGSQAEKSEIRGPLSPAVIELPASPPLSSIYRSIELPVQRLGKPVPSLVRHPEADNIPLIPGFSLPLPLDLPVPVPTRPKVDSRATGDTQAFRYSLGAPEQAETGYSGHHSLPHQGAVTYINRSAAGESSVQHEQTLEGQSAPPDLKALARNIYPYIKRMIMIEKERLPNL